MGILLDRVVGTGFSKEGTSEQRSKGRDRASQAASWEERTLGAASAKALGRVLAGHVQGAE